MGEDVEENVCWILTAVSETKLTFKRTYIIEVLAGFHDERRPLCLIDLHPALAEELS